MITQYVGETHRIVVQPQLRHISSESKTILDNYKDSFNTAKTATNESLLSTPLIGSHGRG